MKFIHTSDWHIGRQFHHVSLLEDQAHILAQIVAYARAEAVDALLIAGDIYDRAIPPTAAVEQVDEVLHTLCVELGIPVLLIAGNHDSAVRLGFGARQLAHSRLHILGLSAEPEAVLLDDGQGPVAFYGLPYSDPVLIRDRYQAEVSSHDQAMGWLCQRLHQHRRDQGYRRSVLLSHCFIGGATVCDSERPLSVGGSEQVGTAHFDGFDYVALGHLHGAQYRDRPTLRYSGSPLKYSFSEVSHHKSVTLVEMDANGHCELRALPLTPRHELRILDGALAELLQQAPDANDPSRNDYILARLSDSGALLDPMHKLRQVYPNLLALERTGLLQTQAAGTQRPRPDRQHNELAMFRDFYQQLQGETLTPAQEQALSELLDDLNRSYA
ncbi:MAG: exonuclease SbcCD subunit D [Thiolinea sp.]